ncbi:MAG: hypothetical protein KAJ66_01135 [Candidatus Omnitrophica bacterium]|nr:hypothetical protein [Candidatus Omnitrophota bacterium]
MKKLLEFFKNNKKVLAVLIILCIVYYGIARWVIGITPFSVIFAIYFLGGYTVLDKLMDGVGKNYRIITLFLFAIIIASMNYTSAENANLIILNKINKSNSLLLTANKIALHKNGAFEDKESIFYCGIDTNQQIQDDNSSFKDGVKFWNDPNYFAAAEKFENAINELKQHPDFDMYAPGLYLNAGLACHKIGEEVKAIRYLKESIKRSEAHDGLQKWAAAPKTLAKIYADRKKIDFSKITSEDKNMREALKYANMAYDIEPDKDISGTILLYVVTRDAIED